MKSEPVFSALTFFVNFIKNKYLCGQDNLRHGYSECKTEIRNYRHKRVY